MHGSTTAVPARHPSSLAAFFIAMRWMARRMKERRNRNALMELSDAQLKDIGLSRGQTESDVHIYCRS